MQSQLLINAVCITVFTANAQWLYIRIFPSTGPTHIAYIAISIYCIPQYTVRDGVMNI
jgi:hypothetical protein